MKTLAVIAVSIVLVVALAFVIINLVVDIIYGLLNPKVRLG